MPSSPTASDDPSTELPPIDRNVPTETVQTAFALGCFWGPDALFGALDGVVRTCVGYAGGTTPAPTYENIGDHIETVRLTYDPDQITYADLLDHFWAYHDPVRAPLKRQYQPALFPYTDAQVEQARASRADAAAEHDDALSTEIIEDTAFTRAEPYHQKHKLRRHPTVFEPFRAMYPADQALADSPAAALANGYVGGYRAPARLDDDAPRLGLPPEATRALRTIAEDRYRA
jgi:Peptide methionine sulfoxide reductase